MAGTELDALIVAAAQSKAEVDYQRVFAALDGAELFFNISKTSVTGADGLPETTIATALYEVTPGWKAIAFFTDRNLPGLNRPFAGMAWREAVQMVAGNPQATGLMVHGSTAWIAVDKATAARLIAD